MKWLNEHNLPEPIYNAIANSDYSKGEADFSVTELSMPPQERRLFKLKHQFIEKDIIDNFWALLGSSVHYVLEKSNDTSDAKKVKFLEQQLEDINNVIQSWDDSKVDGFFMMDKVREIYNREVAVVSNGIQTEHRAFLKIAGYVISGQADVYNAETLTIQDYKVTSVWKYMNDDKSAWERQLNIYRYLFTHNGKPVRKLQIVAMFKDWKAYDKYKEGYPPQPVMVIDIDIWSDIDVLQYVLDRIKLHSSVAHIDVPSELYQTAPCSDADRWASKKFAVMKRGNKKASKVFDTENDATEYANEKDANLYEVIDRSSYKKCEEYCDVAQFCSQHKENTDIDFDEADIKSEPTVKIPEKVEPKITPEMQAIIDAKKAQPKVEDAETEELTALEKLRLRRAEKEQQEKAEDATPLDDAKEEPAQENINDIFSSLGI